MQQATDKTLLGFNEKLCEVIPGGVNSPVRSFQGMGVDPIIVASAAKDKIVDIAGREFIDYCGSWGALIHGHCHPLILESLAKQMTMGTTFGITCPAEERLARKVVDLVSSVDKVRFVSSGTEATMSAVRLARGYTGRDRIVKFNGNYHGHADFFLVEAGSGLTAMSPMSSSKGIPKGMIHDVASLPYNDANAAKQFLRQHNVAAVIVEPIAGNMGVVPASQEFIFTLREETEKQGSLLIFDEVITGFRVALRGAQSIYQISPDLTCFGKILGGGLPIGAFGGKKEIMDCLAPDGPVYQAGTLSGNPLAMEAGYQALCLIEKENFYNELQKKARILTDPVNAWIQRHPINVCLQQCGSMFTLFFGAQSVSNHHEAKQLNLDQHAAFFRYMHANGIYVPPSQFESWFISMAHEEAHLEKTKNAVIAFLKGV